MIKRISIAVVLLLFVGCKKEVFVISNLNGNQIDRMGHGGMGFSNLYPINSMESILRCINSGADGTEIDVQLSKDGVLVAYHDQDLSKSTDKDGIIRSLNWNQIADAKYNSTPFATHNIVTLESIFQSIPESDQKIFTLDIKLYTEGENHSDYIDEFTDALISFFNLHQLTDHVYIESQNKQFLMLMKSKQPQYQLYHYPQTYEEGIAIVEELGLKGISISTDVISIEQINQAHAKGIFVTLWNVDTKQKNKEAIRKNADMIQTDKIKHLTKLLK